MVHLPKAQMKHRYNYLLHHEASPCEYPYPLMFVNCTILVQPKQFQVPPPLLSHLQHPQPSRLPLLYHRNLQLSSYHGWKLWTIFCQELATPVPFESISTLSSTPWVLRQTSPLSLQVNKLHSDSYQRYLPWPKHEEHPSFRTSPCSIMQFFAPKHLILQVDYFQIDLTPMCALAILRRS